MSTLATTVPYNIQADAFGLGISKYDVPLEISVGIFGMETDYGLNVNTSSAGAMGPFQFIPGTAAQYNYPMTNTPNVAQFGAQARAFFTYLKAIKAEKGGFNDAAMREYSGGGYGLAEVQAKWQNVKTGNPKLAAALKASPTVATGTVVTSGSGLPDPAGAIEDVAKAIQFLFSMQFLYLIFGAIVVIFAMFIIGRKAMKA